MCIAMCTRALAWVLGAVVLSLAPLAVAADVSLVASDVGFVTEMGGSAKGDATLAPGAKFNYSVGFEEHYATGALGPVFAPMYRKNYFVFDLALILSPIAAAKISLHAGELESADLFETYVIKETTDQAGAMALATALAAGTLVSEFDSPSDPLVMTADLLYDTLTAGPAAWGALDISHAMDGTFIDIVLTPAGVAAINANLGGKLIMAGIVPTAVPPPFPQQPFGFTGADKPVLTLSPVPETGTGTLLCLGAALMALRLRKAADCGLEAGCTGRQSS